MAKYFIALVPPSPLREELFAIKQHVADSYGSKGALRSPAHITLHMPFELEGDKEKRLLNTFKDLLPQTTSFEIELNGFSGFEPRVVFVAVQQNAALRLLQQLVVQRIKSEFNIFNQSDDLRGFHPHITIAFRDLKKPMFYQAMEEFGQKTFYRKFICEALVLLKHNGTVWEIAETAAFK